MFRNRLVSLALVGLFVWLIGCSSYTRIEPGEVADHEHIRVTTTDGQRRDIYYPVVEADSIKGQLADRDSRYYPAPIYASSLEQVSKLESAHGDAAKTGGAVVLVGAGVVAAVFGFLLLGLALSDGY